MIKRIFYMEYIGHICTLYNASLQMIVPSRELNCRPCKADNKTIRIISPFI